MRAHGLLWEGSFSPQVWSACSSPSTISSSPETTFSTDWNAHVLTPRAVLWGHGWDGQHPLYPICPDWSPWEKVPWVPKKHPTCPLPPSKESLKENHILGPLSCKSKGGNKSIGMEDRDKLWQHGNGSATGQTASFPQAKTRTWKYHQRSWCHSC